MRDALKIYGGLKANLPTLMEREPGFCTDTGELYIGTSTGNKLVTVIDFEAQFIKYVEMIANTPVIWKTPVSTYTAIATTYPTPEIHWTVQTLDDNHIFNYHDGVWNYVGQLSSTILNELVDDVTKEIARQNAESARVVVESGRVANENARATAEGTRITNESARVTAESGRSSAEFGRVSAESARVSAENSRNTNFGDMMNAESSRVSAEGTRVSHENSRVSAENSRLSAESSRVSAETSRSNNESTRQSNESTRGSAEVARLNAETTRLSNEQARVTQENSRVSAESLRASAEERRANAESTRTLAETARMSAENTRVSAENARTSAFTTSEANRQTAFNTNEATREATFDAMVTAYGSATNENTSVEVTDARADALSGITYDSLGARMNEVTHSAPLIREAIPSGITQLSTIDYAYMKLNPNKIKLTGTGVAFVNGYKVTVPTATIISLSAPPASGEREDLVFLEVYKAEVTGAVMSRIRVVDGVDFTTYSTDGFISSNGTGNPNLIAQGGNTSPLADVSYKFTNANGVNNGFTRTDTGLYIAGLGNSASKTALKTYDGYVYAIPLFRVRRRNSGGYSVSNQNGGKLYGKYGITLPQAVTPNQIINVTVNTGYGYPTSELNVGDYLVDINTNSIPYGKVVSVIDSSTISFKSTATATINSGTYQPLWRVDTRPDRLLADIIDDKDILDLRHQVSLTGFNYQSLLEENFDKLLRGELQTKERKKMLKTYHGIAKTPTDANTVFYASLDGTATAEIGGALTLGTGTFASAPTGVGYKFNGDSQTPLTVSGLSASEGSIEAWVNFDNIVIGGNGKNCIVQLLNINGYRCAEVGIQADNIRFITFSTEGTTTGSNMASAINLNTIRGWHNIRATWSQSTNSTKLYFDGNTVATAIYTSFLTPAQVMIGGGRYIANAGGTYFHKGTLSDVSVSNIDRGTTFATLPADFTTGYARITPAMNGQRRTHSDALTSQYTCSIAKGAGSGHSAGLTVTQATAGTWASGDTIKVKGLAGSIISGVIDTDTALAKITKVVSGLGTSTVVINVDDKSKFSINDTFKVLMTDGNLSSLTWTVSGITGEDITINTSSNTGSIDIYTNGLMFESTASTSSPVVKYMNGSTLTTVTGTWSALGTTEATFTLGTNASLTTADIQIEYSLNMIAGQGGVPEVYTQTIAGEAKGKKLIVGTVAVRDDFVGKVAGSTTANPNISKYGTTTALINPTNFVTELIDGTAWNSYSKISSLDSSTLSYTTNVNGNIAQQLFSFNLIRMIEDKYGTIPSVDKVGYVKANVKSATCKWYGYGTCPTGNKAHLRVWKSSLSVWEYDFNNTASAVTLLANTTVTDAGVPASLCIDDNGFLHYIAYTDASDGVTASTIYTDCVYIDVELKTPTGYDVLVPENPRRDDGVANVLLVRKETKEVQTYFNAVNTDGVVTYGDYVPYQDNFVTGTVYPKCYKMFETSLGTGGAVRDINLNTYGSFFLPTQLPSIDVDYALNNIEINKNAIRKGHIVPLYDIPRCFSTFSSITYTLGLDGCNISISTTPCYRGRMAHIAKANSALSCLLYSDYTTVDGKVPTKYIYSGIVSYNGELYLLVLTTTASKGFYYQTNVVATYKLSNRPLIK